MPITSKSPATILPGIMLGQLFKLSWDNIIFWTKVPMLEIYIGTITFLYCPNLMLTMFQVVASETNFVLVTFNVKAIRIIAD